jgi:hypothetical protein
MGGVLGEGLGDGAIEFGGAIAVKQAQECGGGGGELLAALGEPAVQLLSPGHRPGQAVETAVLGGVALGVDQRGEVVLVFDLLAIALASRVRGDDLGSVEDAHGARIGDHDEGAADTGMGHGVVVAVETDVRGLADLDRLSFVGGKLDFE